MQVMPFWTKVLGDGDPRRLFDLRANLRYGCIILRHYLDRESGNLYMALGRYNGSRGRPEYPNSVLAAWRTHWSYEPRNNVNDKAADRAGDKPTDKPADKAADKLVDKPRA
jgi:soluble lytic murein transglycosylase-like protein